MKYNCSDKQVGQKEKMELKKNETNKKQIVGWTINHKNTYDHK